MVMQRWLPLKLEQTSFTLRQIPGVSLHSLMSKSSDFLITNLMILASATFASFCVISNSVAFRAGASIRTRHIFTTSHTKSYVLVNFTLVDVGTSSTIGIKLKSRVAAVAIRSIVEVVVGSNWLWRTKIVLSNSEVLALLQFKINS